MTHRWLSEKLLFIGIFLIAAAFRFYDINWDQGQHLHPDERFLTMVGSAMHMPQSLPDYLNPQTSSFNPANIGYTFYVYGTFPVVLNKLLALPLGTDTYEGFTIQGRMLSGFADLLIVLLLFKTLELFEKRRNLHAHVKYWGAFFYAIAVLPIQLSHFFAVDTFLTLFMFASFYFVLRFSFTKDISSLLASALFLGVAIGSKISAVYIMPLLLFFITHAYAQYKTKTQTTLLHIILAVTGYGLTTFIVGRFADPYLFQSGNLWDPRPNLLFLENLKALKGWANPEAWFPPSVQWIHKIPIIFPFINLVVFGIGIIYACVVGLGKFFIITKYKSWELIAILAWVGLFFLYQSLQFSTTMRYFLPIYPFLALFAGIGFYELIRHWSLLAKAGAVLLVCLWTFLFLSIYTTEHTRTQASQWIYQHIPDNSVLLSEHWDDALPLNTPSTKHYIAEQLPVFAADTPEKWEQMEGMLARGNYLILSSNRGWGSIPTVPERYPRMTEFYQDLFAGNLQYKKVAEFTSYPRFSFFNLQFAINDDWAEEAFTVYDHPKVMIFQKM